MCKTAGKRIGAICAKLLANGWGYLLTNGAIYAKLLAKGWGSIRQAAEKRMGLHAPSYQLMEGAVCAKLQANAKKLYAPSYRLADWAICAKLLANGRGCKRQATG